jgi:hypothetical protein
MCYYTNPHNSQKVQKTKQATKKKISTSDYLRNEFIGHVNTSELCISSSPFTFSYFFSLANIFYLALSQSEFPMNNCINVNLIYI